MRKEESILLLQLLGAMQEAVVKLESYYRRKDDEKVAEAKRTILELQAKIDEIV